MMSRIGFGEKVRFVVGSTDARRNGMDCRRQIWRLAAGCEAKERGHADVMVVLMGRRLTPVEGQEQE